jgi:hypothetical protein
MIFLESAGEGLGGGEKPGAFESTAHGMLSGGFEADVGGAAASPGANAGVEDGRLGFDEHFLLDGGELDHAQPSSG